MWCDEGKQRPEQEEDWTVREERVSQKQEVGSFGPLREVGKVTRSDAGSGAGESTFSRVLGTEGPLRCVEEWWGKDMPREQGGF